MVSYVKNADVTREHVRRFLRPLGYIEDLPEEFAKEGYMFGVVTPHGERIVYRTLAIARMHLRRNLRRQAKDRSQ